MQTRADADYKEQAKEFKRATQYEKAGNYNAVEPEKPGLRKYLFKIATIQSVLKRLSEQSTHSSLWGRDEIKGLFGSLNQFSGNENETMEIVLSLWDRKPTFVDRVDISIKVARLTMTRPKSCQGLDICDLKELFATMASFYFNIALATL